MCPGRPGRDDDHRWGYRYREKPTDRGGPGTLSWFGDSSPEGGTERDVQPLLDFPDPLRRQLGVERSDNAAMGRQLQAVVRKIAPDLVPLVPLLGDVLHIEIEGNDTTKEIDPRFRPDRTAMP